MRTIYKAATVVAMLGSLGLVGVGTASASGIPGGSSVGVRQSTECKSHDLNLDVLGEVGLLNGALGNALGGEGNPGAQESHLGSTQGCSNSAF
ncbi:hypothetical protein [Streptomyces sp. NRRL F-5123]|uniref:hypothetical protein n=1 Tax=Streptomyces sp. NRRL F-5123 TaxID=1463856 RepID=UPI0004E0CA99|nr:hypothetical protein [Streptomyces sp. NRRL F-5123]